MVSLPASGTYVWRPHASPNANEGTQSPFPTRGHNLSSDGTVAMSHSRPFNIRRLTSADVMLMKAMLTTFGEAFEEVDTYTGARPSTDYLERLLGSKHFIALAALKDDSVAGGLTAYELQKPERERSEIYIYDLAVATAHRRQGIATALIEELKTIAVARAAYVIFVQADCDDAPAIALYSKLGTRAQVLHFDIKIGE
jgi:aminoglycoside 3-N-acetyltransferase I